MMGAHLIGLPIVLRGGIMDSTLATNIAMTSISKYRAKQVASELSPAVQIVHELCPSVVLEIGSAEGGTIYAWSQ